MNHNPTVANSKLPRVIAVVLLLIAQLVVVGYAIRNAMPPKTMVEIADYEPWSEELLEAAAALPVQSGGRVKPLSTHAGFVMLKLHGSRKMKITAQGEKMTIDPTAFYLDCLFRPELAKQLPVLRVDNTDSLKTLGVVVEKKRDRYSYNDISPQYLKLAERANSIQQKMNEFGAASLSDEETQAMDIASKYLELGHLIAHFDFSRAVMADTQAPTQSPDGEAMDLKRFSSWVKSYPHMGGILKAAGMNDTQKIPESLRKLFANLDLQITKARNAAAMVPPYDPAQVEWKSYGKMLDEMIESMQTTDPQEWEKMARDLAMVENISLAIKAGDENLILKEFQTWKNDLTDRTAQRGEDQGFDSEISYYQRGYFLRALVFCIISFVFAAFSWFAPGSSWGRVMKTGAVVMILIGALYSTIGIVHRSLLMGRPPVANLYDTIPFIAVSGLILFLVAEYMTRRGVMLAMASVMGIVGLFLTMRFEVTDAKDHMDPLVAVLRSNFWLATHVVMITLGYSGGLMACALSHVYVYLRLAGVYDEDQKGQRFYTRAAYGLICFTLFFSLVGTVLGGIWANDSWGRFWGWDPKENGALLIVIWCLIILHARLAGWMRHWGIHIACIFCGIIVAFSWWGVNMLGTGLHNYGFIDGMNKIWYFYGIEALAMVVGMIAMGVCDKREIRQPRELQTKG